MRWIALLAAGAGAALVLWVRVAGDREGQMVDEEMYPLRGDIRLDEIYRVVNESFWGS